MKRITKTMGWLVVAAALTMASAACSGSEDGMTAEPTPTPAGNTDAGNSDAQKKYTMTVTASKGGNAMTRALTYDSDTKTLSATWATGENVYVKKGDAWATGSLQPETDGAETTLKGSLTDITIEADDNLTLQFPKSGDITYAGQLGTLDDIAANFDWATATVEVESVSATGDIIPNAATTTFQNQQAIIKFTLMDKAGGAAISPSALTVSDGTSTVSLTGIPEATYTANEASNVLYVAFPAAGSAKTISLTATTAGSDSYTYTKENVVFEKGKFYSITVKMERQPTHDLSKAKADVTLRDGDTATGTMTGHQLLIEDGATVTLSDASVTAPAGENYSAIRCLGTATIILADETTNTAQSGSGNYCAAVSVPDNKTLTIKGGSAGTGFLNADARSEGERIHRAGIGGIAGDWEHGGNLRIEGGEVDAHGFGSGPGIGATLFARFGDITIIGGTVTGSGGEDAACIGSGHDGTCGDITIEGGTIYALGGFGAVGIGSGSYGTCGNITILPSVNEVRAWKGDNCDLPYSIGAGVEGSCGALVGTNNPHVSQN